MGVLLKIQNCVKLILRPRKFTYKKKHKIRKFPRFKLYPALRLGSSGLLLLKPLRLNSSHITRIKLFLKRAVKKAEFTKRFCWFNCFPHLPLTRKPVGARMGKGKGKAKKWYSVIRGGVILTEFINLRRGRSVYFMRQLTYKIGIPTTFLFKLTHQLCLPYTKTKRVFYRTY